VILNMSKDYTTIERSILLDKRLSFLAIGIYMSLLNQAQSGKDVSIEELLNSPHEEKNEIIAGLKELISAGYLDSGILKGIDCE